MSDPQLDIGKVIKRYLALRHEKAELAAAAKLVSDAVEEKMELLEAWLRRHLQTTGVDSVKAAGIGTAFFTTKEYVGIESWDNLSEFIKETGNLDFLNHAVNKAEVQAYMKENEGKLPPGVKVTREIEISVRKA